MNKILSIIYAIISFFTTKADRQRKKEIDHVIESLKERYEKAIKQNNISDIIYYRTRIDQELRKRTNPNKGIFTK
jgi:hypothetical protein